nr:hypothetical protein Q903MT_gene215 [Picea sitchensis]
MWHTDPCRQSLRGGVRYVRTNHTVPITKRDLHVCFGSPRDEESYGQVRVQLQAVYSPCSRRRFIPCSSLCSRRRLLSFVAS